MASRTDAILATNGFARPASQPIAHKPEIRSPYRVRKCPACEEQLSTDAFPPDGMFGAMKLGWCWKCAAGANGVRREVASYQPISAPLPPPPTESAPVKVCKGCGAIKSLSDYYPNPNTKDRHSAKCKRCDIARTRAHYVKRREEKAAMRETVAASIAAKAKRRKSASAMPSQDPAPAAQDINVTARVSFDQGGITFTGCSFTRPGVITRLKNWLRGGR